MDKEGTTEFQKRRSVSETRDQGREIFPQSTKEWWSVWDMGDTAKSKKGTKSVGAGEGIIDKEIERNTDKEKSRL